MSLVTDYTCISEVTSDYFTDPSRDPLVQLFAVRYSTSKGVFHPCPSSLSPKISGLMVVRAQEKMKSITLT